MIFRLSSGRRQIHHRHCCAVCCLYGAHLDRDGSGCPDWLSRPSTFTTTSTSRVLTMASTITQGLVPATDRRPPKYAALGILRPQCGPRSYQLGFADLHCARSRTWIVLVVSPSSLDFEEHIYKHYHRRLLNYNCRSVAKRACQEWGIALR